MSQEHTCEEYQKALWPNPNVSDHELAGEARSHLESCEDCEAFFHFDRLLQERLRSFGSAAAPESLRTSIAEILDREQASAGPPGVPLLWGGGILVAAAAAIFLLVSPPTSSPEGDPQPTAVANMEMETEESDPVMLARWFEENYGNTIHIPEIPETSLMGGGITNVDGVRSAAINFMKGGQGMTFYIVPAGIVMEHDVSSEEMMETEMDGMPAVVWGWGESARVLVSSSMSPADLMDVAKICHDQEESAMMPPPTVIS